jgi:hypothetical protein
VATSATAASYFLLPIHNIVLSEVTVTVAWCPLQCTQAGMSLSPGSSAQRGDISVQPEYYTSSLFVEPLRRDLHRLIAQYSAGYAESHYPHPFQAFKSLYYELGWNWLHLRELERRARSVFLQTVMRIILGRLYSC